MSEPKLVDVQVCELCIGGAGGECHVPGCVFWMNDAPKEGMPGRCTGTLGSKPSWMSWGQYDPCQCELLRDHRGPHWCSHLGSPRPETPEPAAPEAPR